MVMAKIDWNCDVSLEDGSIVMTIPGVPTEDLRGNARGHWAKRHRAAKEMKERGFVFAKTLGVKYPSLSLPLKRAKIIYTFVKQRGGDEDNFAIGMKSFLDGLVAGGIFVADDYKHVSHGEHSIEPGKPWRTIVRIEELADE